MPLGYGAFPNQVNHKLDKTPFLVEYDCPHGCGCRIMEETGKYSREVAMPEQSANAGPGSVEIKGILRVPVEDYPDGPPRIMRPGSLTPEERAAAVCETFETEPMVAGRSVTGRMRELIADAIRAAVAEERGARPKRRSLYERHGHAIGVRHEAGLYPGGQLGMRLDDSNKAMVDANRREAKLRGELAEAMMQAASFNTTYRVMQQNSVALAVQERRWRGVAVAAVMTAALFSYPAVAWLVNLAEHF
jgi:hypothetical protein